MKQVKVFLHAHIFDETTPRTLDNYLDVSYFHFMVTALYRNREEDTKLRYAANISLKLNNCFANTFRIEAKNGNGICVLTTNTKVQSLSALLYHKDGTLKPDIIFFKSFFALSISLLHILTLRNDGMNNVKVVKDFKSINFTTDEFYSSYKMPFYFNKPLEKKIN